MVPADSRRIPRVPRYSGNPYPGKELACKGLSPAMALLSRRFHFAPFPRQRAPTTPDAPKRDGFGLFRVRSPLLAESFLFSFPAGIEMFQFPAFAYRFAVYQLALMGCPIRRSAGQGIFAPYRSFSQLITSFFASESLGIHLSPLFTSVFLSSKR